jgi:VWFA-related protein
MSISWWHSLRKTPDSESKVSGADNIISFAIQQFMEIMTNFARKTAWLPVAIVVLTASSFGQTPTPKPDDTPEVINTEEIKVNISAFRSNGSFASGLAKEDFVVTEDNIIHQPSSLRRVPANVLLILDTGGEDRQAKDFKTTRDAAKALVKGLDANDKVSVIHYHDKVEVISGWTSDKQALAEALTKKLTFGKRSVFVEALNFAVRYFEGLPLDNRHIVLITDGTDSQSDRERKLMAIRQLLSSYINVHVLSYTKMEQEIVAERKKTMSRRTGPAIKLPPGAGIPIPGPPEQSNPSGGVTINLDRAMMRKIRQRAEDLKQSEEDLTQLSEDTNGEIYLPESREELIEKTSLLAVNIDSQYVVTYSPKRPLSDVTRDEERIIVVSARREDVQVQGRRKLVVKARSR